MPASVVAPRAELVLGGGSSPAVFAGTYFARRLMIRPDVRLERVVGSPWLFNPVVTAPFGSGAVLPQTCPKRLELVGDPAQDDGKWTSIEYASDVPAECASTPLFRDQAGNPAPDYTREELNETVSDTTSCPAIGGNRRAIDPASFHGSCTSDADCPAGELCAAVCTSAACLDTDKQCGILATSSLGIPAESGACDPREFILCPEPADRVA
ncbi:hypothetical protein ACFL5O_07040 [Myxococcota bacterium]